MYPALLSCPTNRIVLFLLRLFTESDISRGQSKEATISSSSSTGSIEAIVGAVENGPLSQQSNEQPGRNSIHLIIFKMHELKTETGPKRATSLHYYLLYSMRVLLNCINSSVYNSCLRMHLNARTFATPTHSPLRCNDFDYIISVKCHP